MILPRRFAPRNDYFSKPFTIVEKKTGFLSEKNLYSVIPANKEKSLWPIGSLSGQKKIRHAKKGGDSSLPKAGFRRYQPCDPFPPGSLCGEKGR
mgnify:CR=1 FL=1